MRERERDLHEEAVSLGYSVFAFTDTTGKWGGRLSRGVGMTLAQLQREMLDKQAP